jgi:crotonobetainyl-CoA:carnitine CoA-transferase CaiB-like acyl-CoA transferase
MRCHPAVGEVRAPGSGQNTVMPGPLQGVTVLELATLIAGPFAGRILADYGADVIKAEPPGAGDPLRQWGNREKDGRTVWWPVQSRGKKLVTLDLRQLAGQELCLRLAASCDVLLENFRPGTLERWGLGPDRLLEANPRLVIARVSGFGQSGPYADRAGFASVGEAMGGLRYINGFPEQPPARAGISLGDSLAALHAVQGILMALYHRDVHGGGGQVIDVSILESCFAVLDNMVPEYSVFGYVREPNGTRIGYAVPSNVYRSRDGRWVVVAANNDNLWRRLCRAIDREDLLEDERYATYIERTRLADEIDAMIQDWVGQRDAAEVDRILNEVGIVAGPVYSIADIFADPHYIHRSMLVSARDPELGDFVMPGVTPKLSATPGDPHEPGSWTPGADNDEVYRGLLRLAEDEYSRLQREGVI